MSILKRYGLLVVMALIALGVACAGGSDASSESAEQSAAAAPADTGGAAQAPMFEVDPFFPKPLPNHWLLGSTIGVDADAQDHIWIIHRGASTMAANEMPVLGDPPTAEECCRPAPPV